jgi:hypothetical protein
VKRYSKHEILSEINNGNEEVLVYLSHKYFPVARRLLRIRGFRDEQTPDIFSDILAGVYAELQNQKVDYIDFDTYFLNALNEDIKTRKEMRKKNMADAINQPAVVVSQCVSIMDDHAQNLLFSRVAERLSYERITDKFQFSNAVIAQYEVNKAFNQLEGIVKLRMNIQQN